MCSFHHGMDVDPFTESIANASSPDSDSSDSADRLQDLLSALNLPALPTGGSRVRLIAIGDRASVKELVNRLHRCGIPVPLWTPAQPIPNTDEVVRIYSQTRSAIG
jgi:hypothetical protein